MTLLEGKKVVEKKQEELERISKECINKYGKKPRIAILSDKPDEASTTYVKRIEKNCEKFNIDVLNLVSNSEEEFIKNFNKVNSDKNVTGIMFQEPLSKNLKKLIEEVDELKDVEGVSSKNLGKLFINDENKIVPCTAKAVVDILDFYNIDVKGKKVVILGRSNIVGKPLMHLLLSKDATVTICHSKSSGVIDETKNADIVIVAIGKEKHLKEDFITTGTVVIDVGINFDENGKIVGDVDFEKVSKKAGAITPVPGGVGVVTNYTLIENIYQTFILQNEK